MQKLSSQSHGQTMDIVNKNIEKLKSIFPEIITENRIDFDALRNTLGDYIEDSEERYRFTWYGKNKAIWLSQTTSNGTLRPSTKESVNWEETQNLFIEGDNLEALKLLQKSYYKKVKMIYLDPPYNTGNEFIYPDSYQDNLGTYLRYTGQVDDEGLKMSANSETAGRYHTNWLNMMYPRLRLARNLLKDDGVIFISIDDNEKANLRKICDEIFGEENFRNCFAVRRYDKNLNRQFIDTGLQTLNVAFEYIIVYSKTKDFTFKPVYKETNEKRQNNGYWKGFWNSPDRPTMRYELLGFTPKEGQWKWKRETAYEAVKNYEIYINEYSNQMSLEDYWEKTGRKLKFIKRNSKGSGKNMGVEHWVPPAEGILRNTNLLDVLASKSVPEIQGIFDFPKNKDLLSILCSFACESKDLVIDFFAGSCTTAHAVLDLNKEDNGNRKFIMVQLPEPCDEKSEAYKAGYETIADIGKERIRRVANKIKEENPEYQGDLGFKVFKLDSTNIKPWEIDADNLQSSLEDYVSNIKDGRSEEDVLYEILIKYGLDLTLPIEERVIQGRKVFVIGYGALVICLDDDITLETVEGIAKLKDELQPEVMRVVFKDNGFKDDVVKTNAMQILNQSGIEDVKSL